MRLSNTRPQQRPQIRIRSIKERKILGFLEFHNLFEKKKALNNLRGFSLFMCKSALFLFFW